MNTTMQKAMRVLTAALLLGGLCWLGASARVDAQSERLRIAAVLLLGLGLLFATLFRRVHSEDRIADLEAALCREQSARSHADQALAEADLLLARMAARASGNLAPDPAGQLIVIQAELAQIQQRCRTDLGTCKQLERLRTRLDHLGASLRNHVRAVEPG
ncbi:hypothetical protein ACFQ09_05605 [Massilia norwichensis]|uniref:DUF2570 domain-containing protein n=1 Tax=Massilia norwichensis TaxID=1442366 RepID=A0ABT2AE09_9BURK|nr:hypothetical protein [Massilia norwichensis]MCS0592409.1 hypothetical protein [Massilia norwichensis]